MKKLIKQVGQAVGKTATEEPSFDLSPDAVSPTSRIVTRPPSSSRPNQAISSAAFPTTAARIDNDTDGDARSPKLPTRNSSLNGRKSSIEFISNQLKRIGSLTIRSSQSLKSSSKEDCGSRLSLVRRGAVGTNEERQFFDQLDNEVTKIDSFYKQREEDALKRFDQLKQRLVVCKERIKQQQHHQHHHQQQSAVGDRQRSNSEGADHPMHHLLHPSNQSAMRKLRANLLEFYRLLELIQNYRLLNYMAVAKSLKKFDKNSGWHSSAAYMKRSVDSLWFQQSQVVKRLIRDVEHWYTELFTDNRRRSEAMKDLRVPNLKQKTHHFTLFRVGLYVGMSVPILFTTLVAIYQNSILESSVFGPLMSIYAGLSTPVIFMFLFAVNLWVWNMKKVNYKFVFELDPRDNLSYLQFFEFSGILFFAWTLAVYLTFMDPFYGADSWLKPFYPLIYLGIILLVLFTPHPFLYWTSRRWMMRTLARIIVSPYYRVQFRDFFVADELNSFIYFLSSLQLFVCVYVNRLENLQSQCEVSKSFISPAVNMAPALFRLLQCLRQYRDSDKSVRYLFNAGKYGCIIAAAWFSTWYNIYRSTEALALWILISIVATFYGYIWDVIFDWGCFQRNSKNRLLRDELTYRKGFYYFGLVSNFIGRIGWVLLVSVGFWGTGSVRGTVVYIVALIELFRRFQWNFYRMENEHLNNVDGFRVVRDIPLPLDEFGIQGTDFVEHHAADDGQHSQFNSHNITTHSQTLANHASSILEEGHMKK